MRLRVRRTALAPCPVTGLLPSALLVSALALGCERPPVEPPGANKPLPAGRASLDLEAFVQDRHAIEGKWYEYDSTTHTQNPRPQAWVVRDVDSEGAERFAAFHILSIYDDTETGLFTLGVATHNGTTWSAESEWVSPRNEKNTGRLCVDLHDLAGGSDVDCGTDGWQLRLEYFKYFAPLSLFFIDNPGLFARSVAGTNTFGDVRFARLDDQEDLSSLPAPASIPELADGPGASWDASEWDYNAFAPNLPEAGMAIGARFVDAGFVGRDDVYFLLTQRLELLRLQVRPVTDGDVDAGLSFTWATTDVSFEDGSFGKKLGASLTKTAAVPAEGAIAFLRFDGEELAVPSEDLDGAVWPHRPPPTRAWDLAITRIDGVVRLLVSPSAAVVNATQRGLDEALPPEFTE